MVESGRIGKEVGGGKSGGGRRVSEGVLIKVVLITKHLVHLVVFHLCLMWTMLMLNLV